MITTTLFKYIQSELIKQGHDEFINEEGELVFFDEDIQFMTKILKYDEDVSNIVNKLFNDLKLDDEAHDEHFKKTFVYRFLNRQISKQVIDLFKMELISIFLIHEQYLNTIYKNLDDFITQKNIGESENVQENQSLNTGNTLSDNRSIFADLPQSQFNLNVDDDVIQSATDNTISKNKQVNTQENEGQNTQESSTENKSYHFDELFKSQGLLSHVLDEFEKRCFMLFW